MLERIELFEIKKELFVFLAALLFLFSLSLAYKFYKYKRLTASKTARVKAYVLNEYLKTKHNKTYKVLKLTTPDFTFYTTASKNFPNIKGRYATVKLWTRSITFRGYLGKFFAYSRFLRATKDDTFKSSLVTTLAASHQDANITRIYEALFFARPLSYTLYNRFSALGISHLFAISGFHLGILSGVLFLIATLLYAPLHKRFFPFRNQKRDIFFFVALVLFGYVVFLEFPPSLVRAYFLLLVGFFLYDRGYRVFSLQTLFVTVAVVLTLFPKLLFSLGFWLSVAGVYAIALFFIHFSPQTKRSQLLLVSLWVYFLMLPFSLYIFGNFSVYHIASVILSILFVLFYPLALGAHLVGLGDLFDPILRPLLEMDITIYTVHLPTFAMLIYFVLLLRGAKSKKAALFALAFSVCTFFYALTEAI